MKKAATLSRREFLAGSAVAGAAILIGALPAIGEEKKMKKTFAILHTNDMHSALAAARELERRRRDGEALSPQGCAGIR